MSENQRYDEILNKFDGAQLPEGRGKEAIWEAIEAQTDSDEEATKVVSIKRQFLLVAASVTLLVLAGWFFLANPNELLEVATLTGESQEIELPDGSKVFLNAESKISYSSDWDRDIGLEGEAFFEVIKGSTFTVQTAHGSVQVLGTSFNVLDRSDEMAVTCKTGKVRVNIEEQQYSETIIPGEMVQLLGDTVKRFTRNVDVIGKWKSGEFYFQDQELSRVMDEMMRQFDVTIDVQAVGEMKFTGYFHNKDLDQALELVCLPLNLTYTQDQNGVLVIQQQ